MPTVWDFKPWLVTEHGINTATDLQDVLRKQAGVELSLQAVCALLNGTPKALRFQTAQAISNAFRCDLSEFFDVTPDPPGEATRLLVASGGPRRLYRGREQGVEEGLGTFPNPARFRRYR